MKRAILFSFIALATGCAARPVPATARTKPEPIVLPAAQEAPPGTMDVDWQPTPPPPPKEIVPRRLDAKPQLVSPTTRSHGRLFTLPARASKE